MDSFKKWLDADSNRHTPNIKVQSTIISMNGPETEHDQWMPDDTSVQHGLRFSKMSKMFQAFRKSMKDNMVVRSFRDGLLKTQGKNPFNYQKSNWLNDTIQQHIADEVGMPFDQIEPYSQHLKRNFVDIYKNAVLSWDSPEQHNSWPGSN